MKLGEFFTEELHGLLPAENLPWAEVDYRVKFGPAAERDPRCGPRVFRWNDRDGVRGMGSLQSSVSRFGSSTAQWVVSSANAPVLTVRGKVFGKERA